MLLLGYVLRALIAGIVADIFGLSDAALVVAALTSLPG